MRASACRRQRPTRNPSLGRWTAGAVYRFFCRRGTALGIVNVASILRTNADHLHGHSGRHEDRVVEEQRPRIQVVMAVLEEIVAPAREKVEPVAVRVIEAVGSAWLNGDRPRGSITDSGGVFKNLLHPGVGCERLAFHGADGGKQAAEFGIKRFGRLVLHDLVHLLEEREVAGEDRVIG